MSWRRRSPTASSHHFFLTAAASVTTAGLAIAVYSGGRFAVPLGGAVIGGGVACMHYLGMWAVDVPGHVTWAFELVAASIVVGMLLAAFGLHLAVRGDNMRRSLTAAGLVTLAIVLHHFTAMGAVEIIPDPTRLVAASLSPTTLAFAVAGVAAAVLGIASPAPSRPPPAARAHQFAEAKRALIRDSEEALRQQNMLLDAAVNNMNQGAAAVRRRWPVAAVQSALLRDVRPVAGEGQPGRSLRELARAARRSETSSAISTATLRSIASRSRRAAPRPTSGNVRRTHHSVTNKPKIGGGWVSPTRTSPSAGAPRCRSHLAHHDPLTDLPNRAAFTERLHRRCSAPPPCMKALRCFARLRPLQGGQ